MDRTLVECARCMIEHAKMSKRCCCEAILTAAFLRNRCPSRANIDRKSPLQEWSNKTPLLANLKVFGCHTFVHIPRAKRRKLDAHATRCVVLVSLSRLFGARKSVSV
jgi:hypothetical protein